MKKLKIALSLAFTLLFILGCQLTPGDTSADAPATNNEEPVTAPTQAPINTPIPEPTSPPALQPGDIIFQTDFNDISTWDTVTKNDAANYKTELRSDGLYVEVPSTNDYWYGYTPLDMNYSDVRIEADVELVGGTNYTYITLTCRSSEAGEYVFFLDTGGYWQIGKWTYGDTSSYEQLAYAGSTKIKAGKNANHITAICKAYNLALLINGTQVENVQDWQLTEGGVGIGVETKDYSLSQVMFHNLEIYAP